MRKKVVLPLAFVALGALIALAVCWCCGKKQRLAYVDNIALYESFELMKELDARLTQAKSAKKQTLDSLEIQLRVLSAEVEQEQGNDPVKLNRFRQLQQSYMLYRERAEQETQELANSYYSQVWTQLNQYVQDYGKAHGYTFIFGANADGSLMYADEAVNITEALKQYVNERYKGKTN